MIYIMIYIEIKNKKKVIDPNRDDYEDDEEEKKLNFQKLIKTDFLNKTTAAYAFFSVCNVVKFLFWPFRSRATNLIQRTVKERSTKNTELISR